MTPLVDGDQSIGVDIEVQWTSIANGQKSFPYTLGFPKFPVTVQSLPVASTPPPSTPDTLAVLNAVATPLSTIIAAIIGLVGVFIALPRVHKRAKSSSFRSKKKPPAEQKAPATPDQGTSETKHEENNQQVN
ncbi:hypothetical protein [Reticulibacter mediterranei]|uniref:hypothetical protein n=1 Tax=Reticulibacter mediterranei TaxID=2778369 RepID=UPI001C68F9CC|nr:hypothetical protein [Reticulibacter mediterranei]